MKFRQNGLENPNYTRASRLARLPLPFMKNDDASVPNTPQHVLDNHGIRPDADVIRVYRSEDAPISVLFLGDLDDVPTPTQPATAGTEKAHGVVALRKQFMRRAQLLFEISLAKTRASFVQPCVITELMPLIRNRLNRVLIAACSLPKQEEGRLGVIILQGLEDMLRELVGRAVVEGERDNRIVRLHVEENSA